MEMKQCSAGHFYDAERYQSCPYCGTGSAQVSTQPHVLAADDLGETQPAQATDLGVTVPIAGGGETMPLDMVQKIRPVVGWLVCIEGPAMGHSYEIHKENNYLGRSAQMDICIPEDPAISRDSPVVVTYDANSRSFFCGFMGGRSIVRLNGMPLLATSPLKHGDRLELGKTKLMFVPLSGPDFDWNWAEE